MPYWTLDTRGFSARKVKSLAFQPKGRSTIRRQNRMISKKRRAKTCEDVSWDVSVRNLCGWQTGE